MSDQEQSHRIDDQEQPRGIEEDKLYRELIERGDSEEKAARIANIARTRPRSKRSPAER